MSIHTGIRKLEEFAGIIVDQAQDFWMSAGWKAVPTPLVVSIGSARSNSAKELDSALGTILSLSSLQARSLSALRIRITKQPWAFHGGVSSRGGADGSVKHSRLLRASVQSQSFERRDGPGTSCATLATKSAGRISARVSSLMA